MNIEKQLDFLDILTIFSFILQLQNLEENRQQTEEIHKILSEIQEHLHNQDKLIERNNHVL